MFKTIQQAENLAKSKIRNGTFKWLIAGAEDNFTEKQNIIDLQSIKILPKILVNTSKLDLSLKFLNKKIPSPLILSPMGHQTQFHKYGEIETSKGVSGYGTIGTFGTQGRIGLKDIDKHTKNGKLIWEIFPFGKKDT